MPSQPHAVNAVNAVAAQMAEVMPNQNLSVREGSNTKAYVNANIKTCM